LARSRKTSQKTGRTQSDDKTTDGAQADGILLNETEETAKEVSQKSESSNQKLEAEATEKATTPDRESPDAEEISASVVSSDFTNATDEIVMSAERGTSSVEEPAPNVDTSSVSEPAESEDRGAAAEDLTAENDTTVQRDDPGVPVTPASEPPARSSAGSVGLLILGGIIAGLIGVLAARYIDDFLGRTAEGPTPADNAATISGQTAQLADQKAQIAALQTTVEELAARDVPAAIDAAVAPLSATFGEATGRLETLSTELSALSERVETIAMRPTATGVEPQEFDAALEDFRDELRAAIDSAQSEIEDARATAEQISDNAFKAEQEAVARAAWSQVRAALDAGSPYRESLEEVRNAIEVPVPEPLVAHADSGIASLASLQGEFPSAARNALEASIRATAGDGAMDRLTAFLRVQTGARSLTARDGDDPDATLSRAEAALRDGDVASALSELTGLPESGQATMSDWASAAQTRVDVLAAAADLTRTLE